MIRRARNWRRHALAFAMVLPMASVSFASVLAQEAVPVRSFQHSDFARIVFDWPSDVGFTAAVDGQELLVTFDRPIASQLDGLVGRLPDYVTGTVLRDGGRVAAFGLTRPMSVSSFTNGTSIVVDLRPSETVAETPTSVSEPAAPPSPTASAGQAAQISNAEPTADAPALSVRVGTHPTYSRIVFDWPSAPTYTATQEARAVTVDFAQAATIDVAALQARLPAGIQVAASEQAGPRTRIIFAVPDGASIRHFPLEEKVVVDVLASVSQRSTAVAALDPSLLPAPLEAPPSTTEAPASPAEALEPVPGPEAPVVPSEATAEEQDQALANALESGTVEFERAPRNLPDPGAAENGGQEEGPQAEAPVEDNAQQAEQPLVSDGTDTVGPSEEVAASTAEAPAAGTDPAPAPDATVNEDATDQAAEEETRQEAQAGPALVTYRFQWSEDVGAAVFRRADNVWIIFDAAAPLELSPLRIEGSPIIERLDQLPIGNATVLRAAIPDRRIAASARRDGFNWIIEFRRADQEPLNQAPILADVTSEIGPHLIFPSDNPGAALTVPDPDIGDVMRVATFLESGQGIDGVRRYPEFDLLPSAQGLAMIPRSDTVLLDRNFDGFMISAPDGLAISAVAPEAPVSSGPILSARRLFDLAGLMRGPKEEFNQNHGDIIRSLAEVPGEKINSARLDYAGFLMAHGRGHEALGVLRVVERSDPNLMARPENQALRAASLVLANRTEEARTLLNDPRLDGFAEAAIWRGAALAREGMFLEAGNAFGPGDSLLNRYPFPLKGNLGLLRIETAFANRDVQGAESWIGVLERDREELTPGQQAELDYHRARLAVARTDFDLGEELFRSVMDAGDRKFAYRSELALISLGLRQGFMPEDEALERLERLRYAWRGGRSELFLLRRLGELYLDQPNYFDGLEVYRTAVQYFPGDPIADDLAGEMVEQFEMLFLGGKADELPPLTAIALYEEFQELTPTGPVGDRLIENIADRLAALDLLPEAAEKLQVLLTEENRIPPGEERAALSSKLALLYLLDGKPNEAIEALALGRRGTELYSLDNTIELDRDRLLARAQFQLEAYGEAIKELAGDVSLEADLLRQEVYRETDNWQESAKVLQRLAGNPPRDPAEGVEGDRARFVVGWAVSLFQNNDGEGLRDLVDLWGPTMANSSLSGVFDYITNQDSPPTGGDVIQTVEQLLGAERFDAFLTAYRDRLFAPASGPTAQVSASSS